MLETLEQVRLSLLMFIDDGELKTHQLDGEQAFLVSILASLKMMSYNDILKNTLPSLKLKNIYALSPMCIYGLKHLAATSKSYLESMNGAESSQSNRICRKGLSFVEESCSFAVNHSRELIHLASTTSYVAFYCLGKRKAALIALSSSFLIELKNRKCLPISIEKNIHLLYPFLNLPDILNQQKPFYERALTFVVFSCIIAEQLRAISTSSIAEQSLPKPRKHQMRHSLNESPAKQVWQILQHSKQFTVNQTHIFNESVDQIFAKSVCQENPKDLFAQLKQRIENENLALSEAEKQGLQNLETGIVEGRFDNFMLGNFQRFQELGTTLLASILYDRQDFSRKLKDFAQLGTQCADGWLSNLESFASQAKDIKFAVHVELAKLRTAILREEIAKDKRYPNFYARLGGKNNVHFQNAIERVYAHLTRTYEGIIHTRLTGISLVESWYLKKPNVRILDKSSNVALTLKAKKVFSRFLLIMFYCPIHITFNFSFQSFSDYSIPIIEKFARRYFETKKGIVNYISDATKAEEQIDDQNEIFYTRKIHWDAISTWLSNLNEKLPDLNILEKYDSLVKKDQNDKDYLTQKGVLLLLWDLGIIENSKKPRL